MSRQYKYPMYLNNDTGGAKELGLRAKIGFKSLE